jgi:hypothetical protein
MTVHRETGCAWQPLSLELNGIRAKRHAPGHRFVQQLTKTGLVPIVMRAIIDMPALAIVELNRSLPKHCKSRFAAGAVHFISLATGRSWPLATDGEGPGPPQNSGWQTEKKTSAAIGTKGPRVVRFDGLSGLNRSRHHMHQHPDMTIGILEAVTVHETVVLWLSMRLAAILHCQANHLIDIDRSGLLRRTPCWTWGRCGGSKI